MEESNESWNDWSGGECPVLIENRVLVRYRDGECGEYRAVDVDWAHEGDKNDVVAYKEITNA